MTQVLRWKRIGCSLALAAAIALAPSAFAFDRITFDVASDERTLQKELRAASLLLSAQHEGDTNAQDLFAAARGEYGRLVGALYARGYYAPVIRVQIDGREAATIAPLDAPAVINSITVSVDPGPQFRFSTARVAPLAPGTDMPDAFRPGAIAESAIIQ
ncbi:MAG: outer membrane protein assembly factor, partial [Rhodobacteraceae bacterium]|nr:outer membrane protein assembly factor [Paracoccaceae bacterium]